MMENGRIGLLVIDDHPVVRHAICNFLETQSHIRVVGEAGSVAEAVDKLKQCEPDVLVMDLMLPDGSGVDATRMLTSDKPRRVVAFSAYESPDNVQAFMAAGGRGFVAKSCRLETLVDAITVVANDGDWLPDALAREPEQSDGSYRSAFRNNQLSSRETEIVAFVAQGLTSGQIAERLCVSLKTVETHRHNVFKKLGIKKSAQLVRYAIDNGITSSR